MIASRKGKCSRRSIPIPYRDKVNISRAQLDSAQAELARQRADLDRVRKEVPIQIEIARRTFAAAEADRAKAEESLKLTRDEVEKGIDEARAGVKAARASLTLAELEYTRFTRLEQTGGQPTAAAAAGDAVSRLCRRLRSSWPQARLAKAVADRTQIDVARKALEAAQKAEQKAAKGIDLAETGNDQIREIELLVKVKERSVEQARRALEAAENDLAYTIVKAPFPGVVVKRYRHLGDFVAAGSPLLSMYNPELLYVEANLEEDRLPGVEPGNPVRYRALRLRRAVPRAGRLGQQVDRGPVRADAAERRLRRVHPRGPARAGADPDRARRPLAAAPRRADGDGGHRARPRRCRLGRGGGPSDAGARDAIQRARDPWGASTATGMPPARPGRRRHDDTHRGASELDRRNRAAPLARAPALAGRPGDPLRLLRALPDPGPDSHHRRCRPPRHRGGRVRHDLGHRRLRRRRHLRRVRGALAVGPDRDAVHADPGDARVLRRQHPLWRGDGARRPGPRPVRRGVRQDGCDGDLPRHALQAVRPRPAGGDRLLRRLRLLDAARHPAGQRLP